MSKDVIIIVEGPQGVGKTTFTNYLRENMAATDLYRLSGIKDREKTGLAKIKLKYEKLIEYMENCSDINMIFDRTFFSNEVYSRLGYQKYSFTDTYQDLLSKLDNMKNISKYDVYLVITYLEDESLYEKRIKRDKHKQKTLR
jgi:CO dehydrogenase nickel-insertion accessory protein CooC1